MARIKYFNPYTGKWEYADSPNQSPGDLCAYVKTVNGITPDENGNVTIEVGGGGGSSGAVQYVTQTLTEEQQMQARANLGLYGTSVGKVDIVPEQQVTFNGGTAELSSGYDACYDLGLGDFYAYIPTILEINGEPIEGTTRLYYVSEGRYPGYSVNTYTGGGSITLGEGATVQDGETVTIRAYAVAESITRIDEKYLPENVATAVSYKAQSLDDNQRSVARANIDASQKMEIVTLYESGERISFTDDSFVMEIDIPNNLDEYNFYFLEIIGHVTTDGDQYDDYVNVLIPIKNTDLRYFRRTIHNDGRTLIKFAVNEMFARKLFIFGYKSSESFFPDPSTIRRNDFTLDRICGLRTETQHATE